MSIIWLTIMVVSCTLLLINNPNLVINCMLSASADAVSFCINMLGIYAVWLGIINVLDKSGLSDKLANLLSPIIKRLFKSKDEKANRYIAINLSSNILGLGNAATPSGIKAMQQLDDKSGKITYGGLMLLIINSVSIQIIPTTVIGLRENAGSMWASDIIIPTIISSALTCTFAILLVWIINAINSKNNKKITKNNKKYVFFYKNMAFFNKNNANAGLKDKQQKSERSNKT